MYSIFYLYMNKQFYEIFYQAFHSILLDNHFILCKVLYDLVEMLKDFFLVHYIFYPLMLSFHYTIQLLIVCLVYIYKHHFQLVHSIYLTMDYMRLLHMALLCNQLSIYHFFQVFQKESIQLPDVFFISEYPPP